MCLAFPGRITEVSADGALISAAGRAWRASTLLHPDVRPGEWVLVAAGTIVRRIDAAEAEALQTLLAKAADRSMQRGDHQ